MISAWEVYLFMQVNNVIIGLALFSTGFLIVSLSQSIDIASERTADTKDFSRPKRNVFIASIFMVVTMIIPSRETIAAMYIVPKLTSNEVIEPATKEAKELYGIFKNTLIEFSKKDKEK